MGTSTISKNTLDILSNQPGSLYVSNWNVNPSSPSTGWWNCPVRKINVEIYYFTVVGVLADAWTISEMLGKLVYGDKQTPIC